MRWIYRGAAFGATTSAISIAGSLVVGVAPAAADIKAQLSYDCTTPSGTRKVSVRVAAATPARARVGSAIRLGKITVTAGVPADLGDAKTPGPDKSLSYEVSGSLRLAVMVSQNGRSVDAGWPSFRVASAKSAGRRVIQITATGPVPALSPRTSGEVAWHAGALVLNLARPGTAQKVIQCAPPQKAALGRVTVVGGASGGPGLGNPGAIPRSARPNAADPYFPKCVELPPGTLPDGRPNPKGGLNPDPRLRLPKPKFGAQLEAPQAGIANCSRLSGFANVAKLGSASPLAGESLIRRGYRVARSIPDNYFFQQTYNVGLTTPSTSTALGFGFMPTTVTATVEQVVTVPGGNNFANASVESELGANPIAFQPRSVAKAFVVLRVARAAVNGTPVDLGERATRRCRTPETKLELSALFGSAERGGLLYAEGGTYSGSVNIPAFRPGCGAGEDLSPLLTATSSGPGNFAIFDLGPFCALAPGGLSCDSSREPVTLTVEPGGGTTLEAKPFVVNSSAPESKITCASAKMKVKLRSGKWIGRSEMGRVTSAKFTGCKREPDNVPQTVTLKKLPLPVHLLTEGDQINLQMGNILMSSKGTDGCLILLGAQGSDQDGNGVPMASPIAGAFNSTTHTWELTEGTSIINGTFGTSCPQDIPGFFEGQFPVSGQSITASFTTKPSQTITRP